MCPHAACLAVASAKAGGAQVPHLLGVATYSGLIRKIPSEDQVVSAWGQTRSNTQRTLATFRLSESVFYSLFQRTRTESIGESPTIFLRGYPKESGESVVFLDQVILSAEEVFGALQVGSLADWGSNSAMLQRRRS
jgi:hypothetical protein